MLTERPYVLSQSHQKEVGFLSYLRLCICVMNQLSWKLLSNAYIPVLSHIISSYTYDLITTCRRCLFDVLKNALESIE